MGGWIGGGATGGGGLTSPVAAADGGTGITSYTTGDLLKATGATALGKLGVGSNGQVLTVVSGAPAWAAAASGLTAFSQAAFWGPSASVLSGDYTFGTRFSVIATGKTCTGASYYQPDTTSRTLTIKLWNAAGTEVASVTVASPSTAGVATATFASPVALTRYARYTITIYHGVDYWKAGPGGAFVPAADYFLDSAGGVILDGLYHWYGSGSSHPAFGASGERYPIDAVIA